MPKEKTSEKWIEAGYDLFARKGPEGIHVEKIARTLDLNKSSFYHHFGTLEIFYEYLVLHHYKELDVAMSDAQDAQTLDPEYLNVVLMHKVPFMVQVQLSRHTTNPLFSEAAVKVNQKIDQSVIHLWSKHLGLHNKQLALLFLGFVRDTFYARVTFENFNYAFLRDLARESKAIVEEIQLGNLPLEKLNHSQDPKRFRLESKNDFK